MWDGKTWGLQVTNLSEHAMELRALMSAPGGPQAWDLRCYVREKLIAYLQQHHPQSLPRARGEITGVSSPSSNAERDEPGSRGPGNLQPAA
jgi:hypothetical protein